MNGTLYTIVFDENEHLYTVINNETGESYTPESVTTVIKHELEEYASVPQSTLNQASAYGTRIHNMLEAYQKGLLTNAPDALSYSGMSYIAYKKYEKKHTVKPIFSEERIVYFEDSTPLYVGTLDQVAVVDGIITLVDFKTTAELHTNALRIQLTAYKLAIEQMYPALKIEKLACLWLPKGRRSALVSIEPMNADEVLMMFRKRKLTPIAPF